MVTAWAVGATLSTGFPGLTGGTDYRLKVTWNSDASVLNLFVDGVFIGVHNQSAAAPFADDFVGLAYPDRTLAQGTGRWDLLFGAPDD